ncbi:MAG: hypothetical protein CL482_02260 [Acidobacteria bacterium]|nr:hypothetical protein [Acidobacteriota bacterium]HCD02327.1 hypothetical protein [Planctomycetaceae bacterium]
MATQRQTPGTDWREQGFSLIELIISVLVMGAMFAIALPAGKAALDSLDHPRGGTRAPDGPHASRVGQPTDASQAEPPGRWAVSPGRGHRRRGDGRRRSREPL